MRKISHPVIVIPGAQKSGTSTLFEIICRHPNVVRPEIKEPQFFALPDPTVREHISWYSEKMGREEKRCGNRMVWIDASTIYLISERAAHNIKRYVSDPRILIVLRDPSSRAFSSYMHMRKRVPAGDKREFSEIMRYISRKVELCAFEEAVRGTIKSAESMLVRQASEKGLISPDHFFDGRYMNTRFGAPFMSKFEDPFWNFKYLSMSMYRDNVEMYEDIFGKSRVKIIIFEELIRNPNVVLEDVFDFLGLKSRMGQDFHLPRSNKTRVPSGQISRGMIWLRRENRIAKYVCDELLRPKIYFLYEFIKKRVWNDGLSLPNSSRMHLKEMLSSEYEYWTMREEGISNIWGGSII